MRSLVNKLSLFQSFVYSNDFEILCVCETWLSDNIYDHEILPVNFVLYRKDRPSRGGGVLIAVANSYYSVVLPSPSDLEIVTVKVGIDHELIICCVYVPPSASHTYVGLLIDYLTDLQSSSVHCIFVGDFNFPDINWSSLYASSESSNMFCEFIFDCNLTQYVSQPTHVKGNILDLVLSSASVTVDNLSVVPSSSLLSDHFVISFSPSVVLKHSNKSGPSYVLDYSKADYGIICDYLMDVDFSSCFSCNDIEFVWFFIKSVIYSAISMFVPKVRVKLHNSPKWFDSDIRHHLKCLRTLRRRFRCHPTSNLRSRIDNSELLLKLKMLTAKSSFESNLIKSLHSGNSSGVYKYIRSITGSNNLPSTMCLGETATSCNKEIAQLFNEYFHSIFNTTVFELPSVSNLTRPNHFIGDITMSTTDVYDALVALNPTKSMGYDGIGPGLLKFCALPLHEPLHHLFLLSLSQHYLPQDWRVHLIKPIHKSGSRTSIDNYRPISLLSSISKVLEKIVHLNIIEFVNTHVSPCQFGFLPNRSTLHQLILFFQCLFEKLSHAHQVDVIYLDFKKAFDSIVHNILLHKLWNFGITDNLWKWLHAYLSNRVQCVSVNGTVSDFLPVVSGVPQGSILGPLLFLIFINDIPTFPKFSTLFLFADDVKCSKDISSMEDCSLLQSDLTNILNWCSTSSLHLNYRKCSIVRYHLSKAPVIYNYHLNEFSIMDNDQCKDLGVITSSDLSWKNHYNYIMSKAYRMLGLLRRVFSSVTCVSSKRLLYLSLVRSHLMFCSPLWRPQFIADIKQLESVQRRATRFIVNNRHLSYKERLTNLSLLPLMMQFEVTDILFFVKNIKNQNSCFPISDYITPSSCSTRQKTFFKLRHTKSSSNPMRQLYFNRLPRLWNSLPYIDLDMSVTSIKRKLFELFWQHFISNFDPDNACTYHYVCPCTKCSRSGILVRYND